jgi:hypothetical protein
LSSWQDYLHRASHPSHVDAGGLTSPSSRRHREKTLRVRLICRARRRSFRARAGRRWPCVETQGGGLARGLYGSLHSWGVLEHEEPTAGDANQDAACVTDVERLPRGGRVAHGRTDDCSRDLVRGCHERRTITDASKKGNRIELRREFNDGEPVFRRHRWPGFVIP